MQSTQKFRLEDIIEEVRSSSARKRSQTSSMVSSIYYDKYDSEHRLLPLSIGPLRNSSNASRKITDEGVLVDICGDFEDLDDGHNNDINDDMDEDNSVTDIYKSWPIDGNITCEMSRSWFIQRNILIKECKKMRKGKCPNSCDSFKRLESTILELNDAESIRETMARDMALDILRLKKERGVLVRGCRHLQKQVDDEIAKRNSQLRAAGVVQARYSSLLDAYVSKVHKIVAALCICYANNSLVAAFDRWRYHVLFKKSGNEHNLTLSDLENLWRSASENGVRILASDYEIKLSDLRVECEKLRLYNVNVSNDIKLNEEMPSDTNSSSPFCPEWESVLSNLESSRCSLMIELEQTKSERDLFKRRISEISQFLISEKQKVKERDSFIKQLQMTHEDGEKEKNRLKSIIERDSSAIKEAVTMEFLANLNLIRLENSQLRDELYLQHCQHRKDVTLWREKSRQAEEENDILLVRLEDLKKKLLICQQGGTSVSNFSFEEESDTHALDECDGSDDCHVNDDFISILSSAESEKTVAT